MPKQHVGLCFPASKHKGLGQMSPGRDLSPAAKYAQGKAPRKADFGLISPGWAKNYGPLLQSLGPDSPEGGVSVQSLGLEGPDGTGSQLPYGTGGSREAEARNRQARFGSRDPN